MVTNFSKLPDTSHRAAENFIERDRDMKTKRQNTRPGFVDLSDIHSMGAVDKRNIGTSVERGDRKEGAAKSSVHELRVHDNIKDEQGVHPEKAPAGLNSKRSERSLNSRSNIQGEIKGPVNSLKRSSSKMTELSPSDRPIVIGISIPSSRLAEHARSPEPDNAEPRGLTIQQYATDTGSSVAPTIVVTPAKNEAPWSALAEETYTPHRRRPSSSIYSRATHQARAVSQMNNVPPLPPHPPRAFYATGNATPSPLDESTGKRLRERAVSSCTVFDEDDSPPTGTRGRTYSGESQLKILNRSSLDTIATRHRSQGWWNQILSPFLTRSNTMMSMHSPAEDKAIPELPYPFQARATAHKQNPEDTSHRSPPWTPESGKPRSDCTSIWTDASHWEAERRTIGLAFDHPATRELQMPGESGALDLPAQFEGFGAAAEYFQGCWHDQNSPTPFFKCQNHACIPTNATSPNVQNSDSIPKTLEDDVGPLNDGVEDGRRDQSQASAFHQTPANRFSAAFRQAAVSKPRANSEITEIEEIDTTPEVQDAYVAPVVRAGNPISAIQPSSIDTSSEPVKETMKSPQPSYSSSRQLPPYSPPRSLKAAKRIVAVMPPDHARSIDEQALSPEPVSPALQKTMISKDGILMGEVPDEVSPPTVQKMYATNQYHRSPPTRLPSETVTLADFEPPPNAKRVKRVPEESREFREKSDSRPRDTNNQSVSRYRKCLDSGGPKAKKRRCLYIIITTLLLIMIILIVVLAMTLTRKGDKMPIQSQWLNITGYPPIPTGIATIAQPDAVEEDSGCIQPATMWSCALPKEEQQSVAPNDPDQPNFRLEIRFRNDTLTNSTTSNSTNVGKRSQAYAANPFSIASLLRRRLLGIRDSFTDALYNPSPPPPGDEDQVFLGNTTDNNTFPFNGENTPFSISFLATTPTLSLRLVKRQDQSSPNSTDPFPDLTSAIPPAATNSNGTAVSANLLPFPSAQPLRLYNRGLATEHYGFYTYYDRSIFLKSSAPLNSSSVSEIPDDENGGSSESAATVRCTWAQTRFLVQIWTNRGTSAALLQNTTSATMTPSPTTPSTPTQTTNLTASSANDFVRPGSFPYPVSITLDRHGGDIVKKMIYCYGLDDREEVVDGKRKIQLEDRAFGGSAVNPAMGAFGHVNVSLAEGGPGGIDGGTGGCGCVWRNWEGGG